MERIVRPSYLPACPLLPLPTPHRPGHLYGYVPVLPVIRGLITIMVVVDRFRRTLTSFSCHRYLPLERWLSSLWSMIFGYMGFLWVCVALDPPAPPPPTNVLGYSFSVKLMNLCFSLGGRSNTFGGHQIILSIENNDIPFTSELRVCLILHWKNLP